MPGRFTWPDMQNSRVPPLRRTQARVPFAAPMQYDGPRKRLDVVDNGRRTVQPDYGGEGWSNPRVATLALQRFHQCGLFTALVSSRASVRRNVEIETAAENVFAQVPARVSFFNSRVDNLNDVTVFAANVNVSTMRADGGRRSRYLRSVDAAPVP